MTSKLVVNTIEADTGISSVSFASSISMSSTSKFHFSDAGIDIGADTNINRPAAGVIGFNINGGEKVRIDNNGHIHGVGVVTATHFYGDGSNLTGISAGTALSGSTNNTVTTVTGANAITGEANLKFDGGGTLTIVDTELAEASDNFSINIQSGNNDFYVKSGGTIFAAFKGSAKDLQLTSGNLVIGTSGKGIDFGSNTSEGGTSTATVLEDYEEGSYTITSNANLTLDNTRTGYYTKVGNMVSVSGYLSLSTNNGSPSVSGSNNIVLSLPYAVNTSAGTYTGTMLQQNVDSDTATSYGHPLYYKALPVDYVCLAGGDGLRFYINYMELAYTRMNNSHLHVGYPGYTYIAWNITYRTT